MSKLKSIYTNFREYTPSILPEGAPTDTRFFCDDQGNDWYDLMYQFDKTSWKIGFLTDGYVVWATKDVVGTYSPAGLSVAIVNEVPTNQEKHRNDIWFYENGIVVVKSTEEAVEPVTAAEEIKKRLLEYATKAIAPLQDAQDLDMATDDEKKQLAAWKKYRVLLSRVDTSTAPSITWPEQPGD